MLICVKYSKQCLEENTAVRVCYDGDGDDDKDDDDDVKLWGISVLCIFPFSYLNSTTVSARYSQMLSPNRRPFLGLMTKK